MATVKLEPQGAAKPRLLLSRQRRANARLRGGGQGKRPKDGLLRCAMGTRLRAVRLALGYSPRELGAHLGLSLVTVTHYETGLRYPAEHALLKLSAGCAIPVDWFFTGAMSVWMDPELAGWIAFISPASMVITHEDVDDREALRLVIGQRLRAVRIAYMAAKLASVIGEDATLARLRRFRLLASEPGAAPGQNLWRLKKERMVADVAGRLRIRPDVLASYETGRCFPDEAFLVDFCALTGATVHFLYRGELECAMSKAMSCTLAMQTAELGEGGPG